MNLQLDPHFIALAIEQVAAINLLPTGGCNRPAYSEFESAAMEQLARHCPKPVEVGYDVAGNLELTWPGTDRRAPRVILCSHVDTVPGGGRFDGTILPIVGVSLFRLMAQRQLRIKRSITVMACRGEESSRFKVSSLGSRMRLLDQDFAALFARVDQNGVSLEQAMRECGLDPQQVPRQRLAPASVHAALELHIEQGPQLAVAKTTLGLVTGIAGPARLAIRFSGLAGHTGTCPMDLRQDAMLPACALGLEVNRIARATGSQDSVATLSVIECQPNATNVIPEQVDAIVDVRDIDHARRDQMVTDISAAAQRFGREFGVRAEVNITQCDPPQILDRGLTSRFEAAANRLGVSHMPISSGACHDVAFFQKAGIPSALIFIPSLNGGQSHNVHEKSAVEAIVSGGEVLGTVALELATV